MKYLIQKLVLLRNFFIYKKYDLLAKISKSKLPLNEHADFIVSIASYPKRDHLLPAVFQALSKQTVLPQKWILVLSVEDYTDGLPGYLKKLEKKGLEILWVDNNPFAVKKLIPVAEKYPELGVITIDDDFIYGVKVIEKLISARNKYPNSIVGHVGKELILIQGKLNMFNRTSLMANESTSSSQVYFLGGSGTYYPPHSLDSRFLDMEAVHQIIPGRGSDIWFWAAAIAKGTRQVCLGTPHDKHLFIPIPETKQTMPKDIPGKDIMEERFQMAVDYFGIRQRLLEVLPDRT